MRECPTTPTAFRFFTVLEGPTVDIQFDGQPLLTNQEAISGTVYIRTTAAAHRLSVYEAGMNFIPEALLFDYDFTMLAGENATIVWAGAMDGDYGAEDVYKIVDDPSRVPDLVRVRWYNGFHGVSGGAVKVSFRRDGVLTTPFPNVAFGAASEWAVVQPGEYQIIVEPALGGLPVANFSVSLNTIWRGGQVRTLIHGSRLGGLNRGFFLNDGEERYFP